MREHYLRLPLAIVVGHWNTAATNLIPKQWPFFLLCTRPCADRRRRFSVQFVSSTRR